MQIAEQLLTRSEMKRFEAPADTDIQNMIQGIKISNEKMTGTRYIADVSFRFNKSAVERFFLNKRGTDVERTPERPTLILPFLQDGNQTILWDGDNPWRRAWDKTENLSRLTPIYLPLGDLSDRRNISDIQALTSGRPRVMDMAKRYGAGQAIATIFMQDGPTNLDRPNEASRVDNEPPSARIFLFGYNDDPSMQLSDTLRVQADRESELYQRGIEAVVEWLEDRWAMLNQTGQMRDNVIEARILFSNLEAWVSLSEKLRALEQIEAIEVNRLKQGVAETNLTFSGTIDGLRIALRREGFVLEALTVIDSQKIFQIREIGKAE